MLARGTAERAYALYREHRVQRLIWSGDLIEAELAHPGCTVQVGSHGDPPQLRGQCSRCGDRLCPHAVAALLQWLDVRATMLRMGPGSAWRANARHPFLAPARTTADRVDLSHLTGADLRSALELQLSLQRSGTSVARLVGDEVEIRIMLPSDEQRIVFFAASVLPGALPLLHALPRLELEGELATLELSEARLQPVLQACWTDQGIVLDPGYRLADGTVFSSSQLRGRTHGRWARIGCYLCRLLDPATPLVAFHRKGRQVLSGREALRFLTLDHPQLTQHPWYQPTGHLASFRQPMEPVPCELEASLSAKGRVLLRPTFTADEERVPWSSAVSLLAAGFTRAGEHILRAPDLVPFERAGFRLPQRAPEKGLTGTRLAFVRVVADLELPVVGGDDELLHLAAMLTGAKTPAVPPPPGLRSVLRPYQRDGVSWMWARYCARIGALLADDMGLGKTHQVMGLLCLARERTPSARFLVICPRGVLEHWHDLLTRYAPSIPLQVFHGPTRHLDRRAAVGGVVLSTYDILFRSMGELNQVPWEIAVFDEAQRIKNPRTKAARAARKVEAAHKVALTGTPLENRLPELWSVVDLILPGYLGSEREFRSQYRNPSHHEIHGLRQRLSVLTLRRLKDQVLDDLPEKFEDVRSCRLTEAQRALYDSIYAQEAPDIAVQLRDPGAEVPYMHVFALLTRLKQTCNHPSMVGDGEGWPGGSGKLEVFDQILDEALAADHHVVVYSQYVKMIEILLRHLEQRDVRPLVLTGATRDRAKVIRRFNSGQHERVLLASLLAGGVGIDLTGASVVVHYDRWWNPAKENQATDRVHRLGQRRFVQVFKLVTRDTIEERIDAMIRSKIQLLEDVVAPTDEILQRLGRRDLAEILGVELTD
jgi:hypothetical protein